MRKECYIEDLEKDVYEEVKDRMPGLLDERYYDDTLHEIADSQIPHYYSELASYLSNDTSLSEPEDSGLVEGVHDVYKIIQVAIYERLIAEAYRAYEELKGEWEEKKCEDCGEYVTDELILEASREALGYPLCADCAEERERVEEEERRLAEEEEAEEERLRALDIEEEQKKSK